MQESLDILQRVAGRTPDVRSGSHPPKCGNDAVLVELTVDPCQVPQASGGKRLHLAVIVVEQEQVEILQLFPVTVAVQRAPHHGIQCAVDVIALQRCPYLSRRGRWRIVEGVVLMTHGHILDPLVTGERPLIGS